MTTDYYELLGVAKDADAASIKRAYRKRARELHPDVSQEADAEERFRQVTAAYEVLSDDERRGVYDKYGEEGLKQNHWEPQYANFGNISDIFSAFFGEDAFGARGGAGSAAAHRGADIRLAVELDFRDAVLGCERDLAFEAIGECETCDGRGAESAEGIKKCDMCNGIGAVRTVARSIFGQVVQEQVCPTCAGRGEIVIDPCDTCQGTGEQPESRSITVSIPAGIADGQRIRLTGRGSSGGPGGQSGNLYVDVRVRDDERFLREGDDLITVIDLPLTRAALGAEVDVPLVEGETRAITVPAGTQPGTVFVLRGLGSGRLRGGGGQDRGDLRVYCNVVVPRILDAAQSELLEQFADTETDAMYDDSATNEGILGKLRRMMRP